MKQLYIPKKFGPRKRRLIQIVNDVLEREYIGRYVVTVRTIYYQLVKANIIPNAEAAYKDLTNLVSDARLAGEIDWDVITDEGREVEALPHWNSPKDFVMAVAPQFRLDMWDNQSQKVFVVVEKAALAGVIRGTCQANDVALLAARGYPSSSALREMALQYLVPVVQNGQGVVLLHMGDHDPSGIGMSGDLEMRLKMFMAPELSVDYDEGDYSYFEFERIALNMDQVRALNPPPNPAKMLDPRAQSYVRRFGKTSWELDALSPSYLNKLLDEKIDSYIDGDLWLEQKAKLTAGRELLKKAAEEMPEDPNG